MYLQQTLQLLALQVVENALYIHYYPLHLFQYHKEGLVLNRRCQYYECLYCKHIKYLIITNVKGTHVLSFATLIKINYSKCLTIYPILSFDIFSAYLYD